MSVLHPPENGAATDSAGEVAAAVSRPPFAFDLRLFGDFAVTVRGTPLRPLRTRHGYRLLALLALANGQALPRTGLAGRLWPGSPSDEAAAASLRRALTDLRDALGPEASRLESPTYFTLRLDLSGSATCDVYDFDRAIAEATPAALDRAIAVYQGPLMPDLDAVHDSDGVLRNERERRHTAFLDALQRRANRRCANGEIDAALSDLRRLLVADPTCESASRSVMELLAAAGDRAGAVAEYQRLSRTLTKVLGTRPEAETRSLYERIQTAAPKSTVTRAPAIHNNLRTRLTRFIGREAAVAEVCSLLRGVRLLTITGTGGAGKTRLAQEVAAVNFNEFPDGVWEIELAPLSAGDPSLVARTVATTLGSKEVPGQTPEQWLISHLQGKRLLLLLDNCEHLLDACAALAGAILAGCKHVTLLATSREPLSLFGEQTYRVPTLTFPQESPGTPDTAAALASYEAVQLFMDRAALARPGFAITDENASIIALLCRQLDGVPLALELAAARMRTLSIEQIIERLGDRFQFLIVGERGAQPRQKSLRSLIDWSYDLLDENERVLFARLSVFCGGWTLDTAESVCGFGCLDKAAVLILLTSLVDKSLVEVEQAGDRSVRYRMLETIRQYALERRESGGETECLQERHRAWCLSLAEEAQSERSGPRQGYWIGRLESEHNNLRTALDGCTVAAAAVSGASNASRAATGLRLAGALGWFWIARGHVSEGRDTLTRAIQVWTQAEATLCEASPDYRRSPGTSAALALAHHRYGHLAMNQGDYAAARQSTEESLNLRRRLGDRSGMATNLHNLGVIAQRQGYLSRARSYYMKCLALNHEVGDDTGRQLVLRNLAAIAHVEGDFTLAKNLVGKALRLCRTLKNESAIAGTLVELGNINFSEGNWESAQSFCEEGLSLYRALRDKAGMAWALVSLGIVLGHLGETVLARTLCEQSLALRRELGDISGAGQALRHLATIAKIRGEFALAQELSRESLALLRAVGDKLKLGVALVHAGEIARLCGDDLAASQLLCEGLVLLRDLGGKVGATVAIQRMATLRATGGDPNHAAVLWGAADGLRAGSRFRLPSGEQSELLCIKKRARAEVGEAEFQTLWNKGKSMHWEQAVAFALGT